MSNEKVSRQSKTQQMRKQKPAPSAMPQRAEQANALAQAVADPLSASPTEIIALQRTHGNQAVQRLIGNAQRKAAMGMEGGEVDADMHSEIDRARGGGRPLDSRVGSEIGSALGADFSGVRVHTDGQSDALNRSLSAKAFTLGNDIFFSHGAYDPATSGGKELLAHELTHVVQQGGGQANKVQTKLTVGPAGDKYEQEADAVAKRVTSFKPAPASAREAGREESAQRHVDHGAAVREEDVAQRQVAPGGQTPVSVSQSAGGPAIQREILADWKGESAIRGFLNIKKPRSKALKQVDKAVEEFNKTLPALWDDRINKGTLVLTAIDTWRKTKADDKTSIRYAKIQELVQAITEKVQAAADAKDQHEKDMAVANQAFGVFSTFEGEMGQYAGRSTDIKAERFKPGTNAPGSINDLLTRARGAGGELTPETIEAFVTNDQSKYLAPALEKSSKGKLEAPTGMSTEEVRALMDQYKNQYTGATQFPELENLATPSAETDEEVEEARDVSGTAVTVKYNRSDVNFPKRWGLVESAVTRVAAAGFTIPAFKLYLPKFGRQLTITPTEGHTHEVSESGDTEAAMFVAKNNIYMSSRTYNNPKVDTGLSVQLDPSGVATLIHEIGHFLHFHNAPSKFYGLSLSVLKGAVPGMPTKRLADYAQEVVSKYGSSNPREFVAEVFLGLTYKKAFPDFVLKVYKVLGGPIPTGQEAKFGSLTDNAKLPEEGY